MPKILMSFDLETQELLLGAGIEFEPDYRTVAQFISTYFAGFDLVELLDDFKQVALNRSFTWSIEKVSLIEEGIRIHHELILSPRSLSVIRTLLIPDNKRRVAHEEMIIPKNYQRQGLSRDFMLPYYVQYEKAGVDLVQVYASLEAGGYAWAKYGFAAISYEEVFDILNKGYDKGVPYWLLDEFRRGANEFYAQYGYSAHFPIHFWAEDPVYGEILLTDSDWHGELNLRDDDQLKVFREYLYKT